MSKETGERTKILLADDHHIVRQGIRQILERERDLKVVGETDNGLDAVRLARELNPDIIIMEARMPKLSGVEAIRQLKLEHPQAAILILTDSDDDEYIASLIGVGAAGYLLKSAYGEQLVQAIRSVRAGDFVCEPALAQKLFRRAAYLPVTITPAEHLTRRELEVLKLAAKGLGNRDIATQLGVGERTVKGHLMSVFDKLGVGSRTEAVLEALKRGWVSLEDDEKGVLP